MLCLRSQEIRGKTGPTSRTSLPRRDGTGWLGTPDSNCRVQMKEYSPKFARASAPVGEKSGIRDSCGDKSALLSRPVRDSYAQPASPVSQGHVCVAGIDQIFPEVRQTMTVQYRYTPPL